MSSGEIGIALLWKPAAAGLAVIGGLIGVVWRMLLTRIKDVKDDTAKVEEKATATAQTLDKDYYDKTETVQMILLHTSPLKDSIDRQTAAIEKLCERLDRRRSDD